MVLQQVCSKWVFYVQTKSPCHCGRMLYIDFYSEDKNIYSETTRHSALIGITFMEVLHLVTFVNIMETFQCKVYIKLPSFIDGFGDWQCFHLAFFRWATQDSWALFLHGLASNTITVKSTFSLILISHFQFWWGSGSNNSAVLLIFVRAHYINRLHILVHVYDK